MYYIRLDIMITQRDGQTASVKHYRTVQIVHASGCWRAKKNKRH